MDYLMSYCVALTVIVMGLDGVVDTGLVVPQTFNVVELSDS